MLIENFLLLVALGIFTYGAICLYAFFMSDRIIFPPRSPSNPAPPGAIELIAADGERISALHLKNPEAHQTLLYSHGNKETLSRIDWFLEAFRNRGFNVFAYDYPGYGSSTGRPSEAGVYAAAEAAYQHLVEVEGVNPEDIILYGRSLGGGPSTYLASKYPVGGVILEATFISAFRVKTKYRILSWDKFSNISRIAAIDAPILFIHGTEDQTVPFHHSQTLLKAAGPGHSHFWVEGAGHSNLMEFAGNAYWRTIQDFSSAALPQP